MPDSQYFKPAGRKADVAMSHINANPPAIHNLPLAAPTDLIVTTPGSPRRLTRAVLLPYIAICVISDGGVINDRASFIFSTFASEKKISMNRIAKMAAQLHG
jgi:hypothetical protein